MTDDTHGPIFDAQRARLGEDRVAAMMAANGKVQAMLAFALISVSTVPALEYRDDALAAVLADAEDIRTAAAELATFYETLAADWRAQRQESTG